MRALSGALVSRLIATATAPGYLIEIGFSTVQRWSTRGSITWNALSWASMGFQLSYQPNSKGAVGDRLTLQINNHDNVIGGILFSAPFSGITCKAYFFDGDAPAINEVSQIFEGYGDVFNVTPGGSSLQFAGKGNDIVRLPYLRVARNAVRAEITPPGTAINWNGERFEITNK